MTFPNVTSISTSAEIIVGLFYLFFFLLLLKQEMPVSFCAMNGKREAEKKLLKVENSFVQNNKIDLIFFLLFVSIFLLVHSNKAIFVMFK